jgi:hypothetical protein
MTKMPRGNQGENAILILIAAAFSPRSPRYTKMRRIAEVRRPAQVCVHRIHQSGFLSGRAYAFGIG